MDACLFVNWYIYLIVIIVVSDFIMFVYLLQSVCYVFEYVRMGHLCSIDIFISFNSTNYQKRIYILDFFEITYSLRRSHK